MKKKMEKIHSHKWLFFEWCESFFCLFVVFFPSYSSYFIRFPFHWIPLWRFIEWWRIELKNQFLHHFKRKMFRQKTIVMPLYIYIARRTDSKRDTNLWQQPSCVECFALFACRRPSLTLVNHFARKIKLNERRKKNTREKKKESQVINCSISLWSVKHVSQCLCGPSTSVLQNVAITFIRNVFIMKYVVGYFSSR